MNKQDIKLTSIANKIDPNKEQERVILSFSLDPTSFKKLKKIRKTLDYGSFNDRVDSWIESLSIDNYLDDCVDGEIDIKKRRYKHESYRFNSTRVKRKNKIKLKTLSAMNDVTASSLIRFFIHTLHKEIVK